MERNKIDGELIADHKVRTVYGEAIIFTAHSVKQSTVGNYLVVIVFCMEDEKAHSLLVPHCNEMIHLGASKSQNETGYLLDNSTMGYAIRNRIEHYRLKGE